MKIKDLKCDECGCDQFSFHVVNKGSVRNRTEALECQNCSKVMSKEVLKKKNMVVERFTEG